MAPSRYFADPALLVVDGVFHLYPTTDGEPDWGADAFRVFTSTDLLRWDDRGEVLRLGTDVRWASSRAWAPAAHVAGDRYLLYFSAEDNIGVASAPTPLGPFEDAGEPIVPAGRYPGRAIDPSVFVDHDGTTYLLWGNGAANIARLADDGLSIVEDSVVTWQIPSFREAAHLHRRGDRYYLSWSENDTRDPDYRVRWASGPSAHGPWTDGGVLLEQSPTDGVFATGHHTILRLPGSDDWIIAYHRFAVPDGDGFHREIVIDELRHADDRSLVPVTPSRRAIELV
ncbi:family 43 glycosylhydrolase [Curtobacterium sp. NPDC098951]|uniref:family 43 glycosylhydrolase n=1 Tax=Curtobacterium sp. NPDC098951 TaxID=3363974 RepID=UPI003802FCF1